MDCLRKLFGPKTVKPSPADHAVILTFPLSDASFGQPDEREAIQKFETTLEAVIASAEVGWLDGDEFGGGECSIYLYGRDADALYRAIEPHLVASPYGRGAQVRKLFGPAADPATREERTRL